MATIPNGAWRPVLLLDFDSFAEYRRFPERARFVANWLDIPHPFGECLQLRRFRTAKGWHVVVYFNPVHEHLPTDLTPEQTVALQSILGSDWKREAFNMVRTFQLQRVPDAWRKFGRWNTLYSRKMGALNRSGKDSAPPSV